MNKEKCSIILTDEKNNKNTPSYEYRILEIGTFLSMTTFNP